mgnify:CR=1 FL=1
MRAQTPLTIREKDLEALRGINDQLDLDEVTAVYLPLTRLLNLYVSATQSLHRVSTTFLGTIAPKLPYIIGVAGSVAVGKSTLAVHLAGAAHASNRKVLLIDEDGRVGEIARMLGGIEITETTRKHARELLS